MRRSIRSYTVPTPTSAWLRCRRIDLNRYAARLFFQPKNFTMTALAKLLRRLDLPRVADYEFTGGAGIGGAGAPARLYGGLVLAQATVAAARTVTGLDLHALHALFLRPGKPEVPIRFVVTPVKEGRNFHARLVTALQGDETIFQMQTSFGRHPPSVDHQDAMRPLPGPDGLENRDTLRGRDPKSMPVEVRMIDAIIEDAPTLPTTAIWIRANGKMPEDPVMHLAVLVYATDRAFLSTAWRPHAHKGTMNGASLDHSLWLHDRIDFGDWLLFDTHSPVARWERGLVQGALYTAAGRRVGTVAQEGTLSYRRR